MRSVQNLTDVNVVVTFCSHEPAHASDCPDPDVFTVTPGGQFTYDNAEDNGPAITIEVGDRMSTTVVT